MLANQESGSSLPQRSQSRPATRWSHAFRRRAAHRRPAGVILLVVLVLLALFTMLLISFVVATVGNRQSVMQSARVEQTGDSPQAQLYDAFMQVVRGPRDSNSVMGPHSLLEDIYGHNAGAWPNGSTPNFQQGVRGVILPGQSAGRIGYLTLQDSGNGNNQTGVPYLPTASAGGSNNYSLTTGGTGPIDNTQYPHTQLLAFKASVSNDPMWSGTFSDVPPYGFYNGRVITMINGPAAGRSGRIVGYYYNTGVAAHFFQVLGFDGVIPDPGDTFLINGRPFSGTGFGYRPLSFVTSTSVTGYAPTRLLDACLTSSPPYPPPGWVATLPITQNGFQYALLPNPRRGVFEPNGSVASLTPLTDYLDPAGPGGANEDYDAPDFQNMLLAMRVWAIPPTTPLGSTYQLWTMLPSLHRPDLLNYWNSRWKTQSGPTLVSGSTSNLILDASSSGTVLGNPNNNYFMARNLLRKATIRPLSYQDDPSTAIDESENPNFTGSNPYLSSASPILSPYDPAGANPYAMKNLLYGPWDVDNDGDGAPDSVWVDLGMPVQQTADGRRYKPLFAILCVDMDGKLNLNAHSSYRHCPPTIASGVHSRFTNVAAPFLLPQPLTANKQYSLKVGSGYGPSEISLHPLFEPAFSTTTGMLLDPTGELRKLLGGDSTNWIEGRYGELELTGTALSVPPSAGITWIDDPMNWRTELNLPSINPNSWGNWSQRQLPYLPINFSTGQPYTPLPYAINPSAWSNPNPQGYQYLRGYGSAYGSPPDLDGDGMIALDLRGQPMYIDYASIGATNLAGDVGWGEPDEVIDDPYELDLSLNAPNDGYSQSTPYGNFMPNGLNGTNYVVSVDTPFTAAEIERILRWRDADATSLPDRIVRLAPLALPLDPQLYPIGLSRRNTSPNPPYPEIEHMPHLMTHASFDLPVPSMAITSPDLVDNLQGVHAGTNLGAATAAPPPLVNSHITQLLAARLAMDPQGTTYPPTGITAAYMSPLDYSIAHLLPPELIAGEKMNINRPLGNGYDDNNNGIVDEQGENDYAWSALMTGGSPNNFSNPSANTGVLMDLTNTGFNASQVTTSSPGTTQDANGDHILDGRDQQNIYARQTMARYLYVLMMLLADHNGRNATGVQVQGDADGNGVNGQPADTPYYFAQWAVNVVDFMDSDSIMTPFEFDLNPFKDDDGNTNNGTWDVDGIVLTTSEYTTGLTSDDHKDSVVNGGYRGLVWGCERPELLITETIATHDRRTQDTSVPSAAVDRTNGPDKDFDQVRRPQGSLIIELFNPNPPFTTGGVIAGQKPNELYTNAFPDAVSGAPQFGVNLAQQYSTSNAPTWRIAVRPRLRANNATLPLALRNPVLNGTGPNSDIDRVLYFVQHPPGGRYTNEGTLEFYSMSPTTYHQVIPPNHYALIAPAAVDPYDSGNTSPVLHLGARLKGAGESTGVMSSAPSTIQNKYKTRIQFSPYVTVFDDYDNQAWPPTGISMASPYTSRTGTPTDVKPCVGIPVSTLLFNATGQTLDPSSVTANSSVRWSLTEPDIGYPIPTAGTIGGGANNINDNAYYLGSAMADRPYDSAASGRFNPNSPNDAQRLIDITDANNAGAKADGTITKYTTIYLQRLANPTMYWDARANPYIIVDQMWVDLTTYNSEKGPTVPAANKAEYDGVLTSNFLFDTRRRAPNAGAMNTGTMIGNANNVWYYNVNDANLITATNPVTGSLLNPIPGSTLGYLNNEYGNAGNHNRYLASGTKGASIPAGAAMGVNASEYRGDPTSPFPWLNWNNRPFVSAKELMLVPLSSPSSLSAEISTSNPNSGTSPYWPGQLSSTNSPPYQGSGSQQPTWPMGEYGHLPNVFHSPAYAYAAPNTVIPRVAPSGQFSPNFYRLFEYIHVPSRFTGTEDWLIPGKMTATGTSGLDFQDPNTSFNNPNKLPVHQLHPPFNRVSRFRDPGKVNINTVLDHFVWQGIIDDEFTALQPPTGALWRDLWIAICQSRFGASLPTATPPLGTMDSSYAYLRGDLVQAAASIPSPPPTIFGRPFRSYGGHTLVPVDSMRREATNGLNVEREIDSTFLRSMPFTTTTPYNVSGYPLLEYPGLGNSNYNWAEYNNTPAAHIDDETRNPYFAYKAFRRLDNLLTTRSNVYSVWITVGYFEVTPAPSNDPQRSVKYPDGWVLGQEVGADTGDIQRHRAFYMYDRSIPVGFERGENHNVNKGILLERFIE